MFCRNNSHIIICIIDYSFPIIYYSFCVLHFYINYSIYAEASASTSGAVSGDAGLLAGLSA
jgi:hypothetical protein